MLDAVEAAIEKYGMLSRGDGVTVALSGGADSVALLRALLCLRDKYALDIAAVHVNHRLRGAESDRDEAFCRGLCEGLGVELCVEHIDAAAIAASRGQSVETAAREERYRIFEQARSARGFTRIATAHNANDNAETVIMNIIRGTALAGLCGIPPVRGSVIRPLIFVKREDIEKYLAGIGQKYVTDSTNGGDDYRRNRVRHHILPLMEKENPAVVDAVTRMCLSLRRDEEELSALAAGISAGGRIDIKELEEAGEAVALRAVRKLCEPARLSGGQSEAVYRLALYGGVGDRISIPGGAVERGYGDIHPYRPKTAAKGNFALELDPAQESGAADTGEYIIKWKKIVGENAKIKKNLMTGIFNCDKINHIVEIRPRRTGDAYPPFGFSGRRSVKKMLIDAKIPERERGSLPVFVCGDEVIWCAGLRVSDIYGARRGCREMLEIEVINKKEGV